MSERHVVTGAFGFSGRYIAQRLLDQAHAVDTLTNSPNRPSPLQGKVTPIPYRFDRPDELARSLEGARVLYNTYWVRFNHKRFKFADAVKNTLTLFEAARKAGVERIVHISIANADADVPLEYFRDKGILEQALKATGISHAILRPAVIFGPEDILINNIVWAIRRVPVFCVFGDGEYRLRPIYVDDLAALAVAQGQSRDNITLPAVGPETFSYEELVRTLMGVVDVRRTILHIPPWLGLALSKVVGWIVGDVFVTRDEIDGLMRGLLHEEGPVPPQATTRLTDWAREHKETLGRRYHSELARRIDREREYRGI